jgi:hypothetical protein
MSTTFPSPNAFPVWQALGYKGYLAGTPDVFNKEFQQAKGYVPAPQQPTPNAALQQAPGNLPASQKRESGAPGWWPQDWKHPDTMYASVSEALTRNQYVEVPVMSPGVWRTTVAITPNSDFAFSFLKRHPELGFETRKIAYRSEVRYMPR